jgi:hypothetical protein
VRRYAVTVGAIACASVILLGVGGADASGGSPPAPSTSPAPSAVYCGRVTCDYLAWAQSCTENGGSRTC